eukprot:25897-Alexandrium_andersonii.AAC.1
MLESVGPARAEASARRFGHAERDLRRAAHGDDFAFAGYDEDLDWPEGTAGHFARKVGGRLGGRAEDLHE